MSRLWDKGLPLDARVLRYTAGEDHVLDARLVHYDVLGSTAHAEMLAATGLISDADCAAICSGLKKLDIEFAAGEWEISLQDEDAHTAFTCCVAQIPAIGISGLDAGLIRAHRRPPVERSSKLAFAWY